MLHSIYAIAEKTDVGKNLPPYTERPALTNPEFAYGILHLLLEEPRITRELPEDHHVAKEANLTESFVGNKKEREALRRLEWVVRVLLVVKAYPLIKRQRSATSKIRCLI